MCIKLTLLEFLRAYICTCSMDDDTRIFLAFSFSFSFAAGEYKYNFKIKIWKNFHFCKFFKKFFNFFG